MATFDRYQANHGVRRGNATEASESPSAPEVRVTLPHLCRHKTCIVSMLRSYFGSSESAFVLRQHYTVRLGSTIKLCLC